MNKSFVSIVDDILLPASLMVVAKFLGVLFTIAIFDLEWTLNEYANDLFSFGSSQSIEDIKLITSYSDLFMYFVLAVFFSLNIFRAVFLHTSHVNPKLVRKLIEKNMMDIMRGSFEIYTSASIWLAFSLLANLLIFVNVFQGNTYLWVGGVTLVSTVLLCLILFQDVYQEIKNIKKNPSKYLVE